MGLQSIELKELDTTEQLMLSHSFSFIHRKVLTSWTWAIWFSLIHKSVSDVKTTCP